MVAILSRPQCVNIWHDPTSPNVMSAQCEPERMILDIIKSVSLIHRNYNKPKPNKAQTWVYQKNIWWLNYTKLNWIKLKEVFPQASW